MILAIIIALLIVRVAVLEARLSKAVTKADLARLSRALDGLVRHP